MDLGTYLPTVWVELNLWLKGLLLRYQFSVNAIDLTYLLYLIHNMQIDQYCWLLFFRVTIWKWKRPDSLLSFWITKKSKNFSYNQTNCQFAFGFWSSTDLSKWAHVDLFLKSYCNGSISQFSHNTWSQKETLEFRKDDSDSWEDNFVLLFLLQSFRSHLSNRSQK